MSEIQIHNGKIIYNFSDNKIVIHLDNNTDREYIVQNIEILVTDNNDTFNLNNIETPNLNLFYGNQYIFNFQTLDIFNKFKNSLIIENNTLKSYGTSKKGVFYFSSKPINNDDTLICVCPNRVPHVNLTDVDGKYISDIIKNSLDYYFDSFVSLLNEIGDSLSITLEDRKSLINNSKKNAVSYLDSIKNSYKTKLELNNDIDKWNKNNIIIKGETENVLFLCFMNFIKKFRKYGQK